MDMSFWNAPLVENVFLLESLLVKGFMQVIVQDDSVVDYFSPYILLWHNTASRDMWWEWQPECAQWKEKEL